MMKKVLLRAPVLTQSGYGVHARQVASWLFSRTDFDVTVQLLSWGEVPWMIDKSNPFIEQVMKRTLPITQQADISIQLQLPNEWDPNLGKFNVGMTAAVETDICNPSWKQACNSMNHIIVPSEHTKKNLLSNGELNVPITVVPEAFSPPCLLPPENLPINELPEFSTKFNFLIFGQITGNNPFSDRKNTFFMLKWLFETFKDNPDVGIILKTNLGRNTLIDRNLVHGMVSRVIAESRKGLYPKVHVLHGDMPDDLVAALYKHPSVKALVAASRGEGFGLPILEAAASGLPVIATNWSGHTDFLKLGEFIKIFYQLSEIPKDRVDKNIFMKSARWANPSEQDFKSKTSKFYNSPTIPQTWAKNLMTKIHENYSLESISKRYDELFNEFL